MARPSKREALIRNARQGQPFTRVEIPRTTCPRCGAEQYALADGTPRPHLRATVPGEELYSSEIPTMVDCDALPDALRVKPELIPPGVTDALSFLVARDELIDAGVPVAGLPTYAEWVHRG